MSYLNKLPYQSNHHLGQIKIALLLCSSSLGSNKLDLFLLLEDFLYLFLDTHIHIHTLQSCDKCLMPDYLFYLNRYIFVFLPLSTPTTPRVQITYKKWNRSLTETTTQLSSSGKVTIHQKRTSVGVHSLISVCWSHFCENKRLSQWFGWFHWAFPTRVVVSQTCPWCSHQTIPHHHRYYQYHHHLISLEEINT